MTPPTISSTDQLEDQLSQPTPAIVKLFRRLTGDVLLLGVGGKMGPSLAHMVKRASDEAGLPRRIMGASRFTNPDEPARLRQWGIEPLTCDLLVPDALAALPDAPNVLYLVGWKFGSKGQEPRLWAANSFLPGLVCRRFRQSRMVAFSTGNVYGMVPPSSGGSRETDPLQPLGEYAMSCVGRERLFEHFSCELGIPVALIRLNYACDLRYGVLVDIARRVWKGEPVDVSTGHFNTLWQGDANVMTLLALEHTATPPLVLNVTGPETISVREAALALGRRLGREVRFTGAETETALLSNASQAHRMFGPPRVSAEQLMDWVADWVKRDGDYLGKPTKFESRDGKY